MIVNWPERFYCNSPVRRLQQMLEARRWLRLRPLPPGADILEIGCGNGSGGDVINALFRPRRFLALDLDPAMLRPAARRLGPQGIGVIRADAQHLPVAPASVDAVFNFGIIHPLEDWRQGRAEGSRVLRPGGAFYFEEIFAALYANAFWRHIVAHPTQDRFQGLQFRQALAHNGLTLLPGARESRLTILGVAQKREDA